MRIKNAIGTAGKSCSCGTWLKHWQNKSGQALPTYCPVTGCLNKDLVGAHVRVDAYGQNGVYIYPLCNAHNQSTQSLEVLDAYRLVDSSVH